MPMPTMIRPRLDGRNARSTARAGLALGLAAVFIAIAGGCGSGGNAGPGGDAAADTSGHGGGGTGTAGTSGAAGAGGTTGSAGAGGTTGSAGAGNGGRGGAAGTGGRGGAAATGGRGGAAGTTGSAGMGGSGGAACGARACTSSELCVHPSCGGAAPACLPAPDSGQCPAGYTLRICPLIGGGTGPGCEPPPCQPPDPYCLTPPASCGAMPTCPCLPSDVCHGGGACGIVSKSEVLCLSA
jgi:hypothetical protein